MNDCYCTFSYLSIRADKAEQASTVHLKTEDINQPDNDKSPIDKSSKYPANSMNQRQCSPARKIALHSVKIDQMEPLQITLLCLPPGGRPAKRPRPL